ncbi:YihY/virulence factor BrkB family protein [Jongsikchunia kroppenstedtii]|uniref:YihY/virulence factor BrkB family protein n=1 Tax=Jongsikchunia kroppenstedtii TaxID=1121721 RepID=UPI001FE09F1B|nr:YihY/virulence factor BrkB family protein [Jongsikchunia kroppenstedtii]
MGDENRRSLPADPAADRGSKRLLTAGATLPGADTATDTPRPCATHRTAIGNAGVIDNTEPIPPRPTPPPAAPSGSSTSPQKTSVLSVLRAIPQVAWQVANKAWDDGIFARSAQAAFWQTLSLPPLLLALLGTLGSVASWFGPDTIDAVRRGIVSFSHRIFSESVVNEIILPSVNNVLAHTHGELISLGFIMSLWAGSSAMSSFIDSIDLAHGQHKVRHPVKQRLFALWVYLGFLVVAIFAVPMVALGPRYVRHILPKSWEPLSSNVIDYAYFPVVALLLLVALTTLYRIALPHPLPWRRLAYGAILAGVIFWCASAVLRVYLQYVAKVGYSYGALSTPIAFLLFTFFLGFAIVGGAELNAVVQERWPAKPTYTEQVREWVSSNSGELADRIKRLPTGPILRRGEQDPRRRPDDR